MGNAIEYECGNSCDYWEIIHGINGKSIYGDKYKNKCSRCTRPTRERLADHGIYPPLGGFQIGENDHVGDNE